MGKDSTATFRAVVIGLLLIPPTAWWLMQIEYLRYSDTPTIPAIFFHCIATLLLITGLNGLLRRFRPGWAFNRAELLTVYTIQVIGSNLAGHDQLQILFTTLSWVTQRATPENRWDEVLLPYLPKGVMPPDSVLKPLFEGNSSLYAHGYWKAWLAPLGFWIAFVLAIAFTMFCLMSLMRKQWDRERLVYPLCEIPLAITWPNNPLFRETSFWVAFGLAAGMQLLNLWHTLNPSVPGINLGVRYYSSQVPPWNAAGPWPVCFYPFAIGLTFMLPVELGFSCWFFFLLSRFELIAAASMGHRTVDGFPYVYQQSTGAYVGFALFALYNARHHLNRCVRCAFGRDRGYDNGEPLPYSIALAGLALGLCLVIAALVRVLGMRLPVAVTYVLLLFLLVLAVTRLRAEVGLPTVELYCRGADDLLRRVCGTQFFSSREHVAWSLLFFLNRTHRQFPMQHQADCLRVADRARMDQRRFSGALIAATVVGAVCAFWMMLHVTYQEGLGTSHFAGPPPQAFGQEPWNRTATWLLSPVSADRGSAFGYTAGIVITWLLVFVRSRYLWWPLHPAGYVVQTSFALQRLWIPLVISWSIKSLLLRYGGLNAYRKTLPFFMGLVLGEFSAGLARTLLDLVFDLRLPFNSGIGGL